MLVNINESDLRDIKFCHINLFKRLKIRKKHEKVLRKKLRKNMKQTEARKEKARDRMKETRSRHNISRKGL